MTMTSIPRGWRSYGHAIGHIMHSWQRPESSKSSTNMLLMSASLTSSQMSVNSTKSSQTFLFQSFTFLPRNNPPEVSFDLYAENHHIPLTEFCDICMIPSDGSLVEPRPAEFEAFYRSLTVGDERGVSATTAAGLHFPSVHYFALFVAKCLLSRDKVGALGSADLAVLRHAL